MPSNNLNDDYRAQWAADIAALMNMPPEAASQLWIAIKNLECHKVYEQFITDKTRDTYEFVVPPIGKVTLKRAGSEWEFVDMNMSPAFKKGINEAIRNTESNLHRELYDQNLTRLSKYVKQYSESQRT